MSESPSQKQPDDRPEQPEETPTSEELDVEGPNESAPGHRPESDEERAP